MTGRLSLSGSSLSRRSSHDIILAANDHSKYNSSKFSLRESSKRHAQERYLGLLITWSLTWPRGLRIGTCAEWIRLHSIKISALPGLSLPPTTSSTPENLSRLATSTHPKLPDTNFRSRPYTTTSLEQAWRNLSNLHYLGGLPIYAPCLHTYSLPPLFFFNHEAQQIRRSGRGRVSQVWP